MTKSTLSADEVKKQLHITDFRSISKKQLTEFVSNIPNMEKETAIECIKQFPNFKDYAESIISQLYNLCDVAIKDDQEAQAKTIESYRQILNDLSILLKRHFLSEKKRRYIIEKMIEVADKLSELENERRKFKQKILTFAGAAASFTIAISSAILGVKISRK